MLQLFVAAHEASRMYAKSWRRENIIRAQDWLRVRKLNRRLTNFYLDEIDREVDRILFEDTFDAA